MQIEELSNIFSTMIQRFKDVYGTKLKSVILYGSVAKGTAEADSDIDIMILIDGTMEELKLYEDKLSDISTDFSLEYIKVFSIIDVCYTEFVEWKHILPFYRNVENEGVILYAA